MFIGNSFSYPPTLGADEIFIKICAEIFGIAFEEWIASYPDHTYISKDLGALEVEVWEISSCTARLTDFLK